MSSFKQKIQPTYDELVAFQNAQWSAFLTAVDDSFWDYLMRDFVQTPLKTKEMKKKELKENLTYLRNSSKDDELLQGFSLVMDHEKRYLNHEEHELFHRELSKAREIFLEKGLSNLTLKTPLYEYLHLSIDFLNCIQKIGIRYMEAKHYKEATSVFELLIQLAPNLPGVWLSLGKAFEASKHYPEAITCYLTAGYNAITDPLPFLLAAKLSLKSDKSAAQEYLNFAKEAKNLSEDHKLYSNEIASLEQQLKT